MPVYRVSALQSQLGQAMMNVYHYVTEGALSASNITEVADAFRTAYIDSTLRTSLSTGWSYLGVAIRRVDLADQPEVSSAPTAGGLAGTAPTDPLPTQVSALVRGTALTEFPRRVRTYVAGTVEGSLSGGLWQSGFITKLTDFIEEVDSIGVTTDVLDRVAVRYTKGEGNPTVEAFNRIATYSVTNVPATQRRRRIGVGG